MPYHLDVSSNRRTGVAAAAMLGAGLLLMVVPPVVRDGACGLTSCSEQVPPIAVTRVTPSELAVVVPDAAAPSVRSVELLHGGDQGTGSRQWLITRDGNGVHSTFVMGSEPAGFRTVVGLDAVVAKDVWTAQVGFRCTTASLPFSPTSIAVGEVRSWDGVLDGARFAADRQVTERCAAGRPTGEVVLLVVGAVLAVAGAVLGIVVVLRRPVRFPEDPDGEDAGEGEGPSIR